MLTKLLHIDDLILRLNFLTDIKKIDITCDWEYFI